MSDSNQTEKQPTSDPEMPVPTPPAPNVVNDERVQSELVDEQIEDRFEATDN